MTDPSRPRLLSATSFAAGFLRVRPLSKRLIDALTLPEITVPKDCESASFKLFCSKPKKANFGPVVPLPAYGFRLPLLSFLTIPSLPSRSASQALENSLRLSHYAKGRPLDVQSSPCPSCEHNREATFGALFVYNASLYFRVHFPFNER